MKILITGGLGFIASNFIRRILKNKNIQVVNIDAEFFGSSHSNLSEIKDSKTALVSSLCISGWEEVFLNTGMKMVFKYGGSELPVPTR